MAKKINEATKTELSKGILLIALGHAQYGRLAYNLAVSIKLNNPTINIALAHNVTSITHLDDRKKSIFSHLIEVPVDNFQHEGKFCAVKSKVYAYELSPFDNTLFLDSDMAMFPNKNINNIFESLKDVDFTIKNSGYYDCKSKERKDALKYGYSAKLEEIINKYKPKDKIWQVQGEVFYFNKSKKSEDIFKHAQEAFTKQDLILENGFAGCSMNDELAFITALIKSNHNLHKANWMLSFWYFFNDTQHTFDTPMIMFSYDFLSIGGHNVPLAISNMYSAIVSQAYRKLGLGIPFKFENKINYLPERKSF